MRKFLVSRWFLLALAVALGLGMTLAPALQPLASSAAVRNCIVATVLFLMALPLQASAMWQAMKRPLAPLLAVAISYGLLPLVAWGVSFGLAPEFGPGLLVAAATPCTLASASVWTRRAGGNDSAAILVTIITNLTCFVVTPLWLVAMTGVKPDSEALQLATMVEQLGLLVVLPMALAQLLRLIRPVGDWATRGRVTLGVLAQCGILSMIFIGAIQTGLRLSSDSRPLLLSKVVVMIAAVMAVHLSMLAAGFALARFVGLSREDQIAVGFAGSQKTLMVGLKLSLDLQYSILPIVVYHVGQLLVDTLIADRLKSMPRQDRTGQPARPEPGPEDSDVDAGRSRS